MHKGNKVLFIINRFAGTAYTPEIDERIYRSAERYDVEVKIEYTQGPGHATVLARDASIHGVERVVAVGGDGTLNEVASGVLQNGLPMGIIPRGSGNGLARHLSIPLSIQGSLDSFFAGIQISMDTFWLNNKLSLNVSGIGFDGHIANLFGGRTKRGLTGYAKLTLSEFISFKEFKSVITTQEDQFEVKAFVLAIANSSQYSNNASIAPAALVTDGSLHLNMLRKVPPYRFDFVYAFFNKTIDRSPFCDIRTLTAFTVDTTHEIPYHVDGEPCGLAKKFDIRISPASLSIIVPPQTVAC